MVITQKFKRSVIYPADYKKLKYYIIGGLI